MTHFERAARWGAATFALLAVAFVFTLVRVIMRVAADNPFVLLVGLPGWAGPLLLAPWLLAAGSVALVVAAAVAWQRGAWTSWGRIHFTVVALASVGLVGTLFAVGLS